MAIELTRTAITATTYSTPQVSTRIDPRSHLIINESTLITDVVVVSFDGTNDHARLIPGISQSITFNQRAKKIWFRLTAAGSVTIQAISEE